ncbi:hypothetical protein T10_12281 [Trichinella papuae]|uniref:Uncharacterized protein n=1 Tax=Trichinella papuae TaxID=268474 RepID=A0A0V1M4B0_9BILA|nr:hypothetical protein T10_12281 [Trichinella papuae]
MAVALDAEAMQYLISRIAQLILTVSFNELMLRRDLCNLRSAGIIKKEMFEQFAVKTSSMLAECVYFWHNVPFLKLWFMKHEFVQV